MLLGQVGAKLQNSRSDFKILEAGRVTWSEFHTEDPNISGSNVHKLLSQAIVRPGFVFPCLRIFTQLVSVFKATQNVNLVIYVTLLYTHKQLVILVYVILYPGANDYEV
jgi:hypothetical protein